MKSSKLLTVLSVLALAAATGAFAQSNSTGPYNPNCTQGTPDCDNYVTTDHSDQFPTNSANGAAPNCSQGQAGCQIDATTDRSDVYPTKSTSTTQQ